MRDDEDMEKKERSLLIFSYVFFLPLLVVDGYRVVAVFVLLM